VRTPGDRPPYIFLALVAAALVVYLTAPAPPPAAEILRDGPSPAAPYQKPDLEALLSGRACIPMKYLLENRPQEPVHTYSRPVACEGSTQ
jgi:hypothetical protein